MGKLLEKSWENTPQDFCHFEKVKALDGAIASEIRTKGASVPSTYQNKKIRNRDASSISVLDIGQARVSHMKFLRFLMYHYLFYYQISTRKVGDVCKCIQD